MGDTSFDFVIPEVTRAYSRIESNPNIKLAHYTSADTASKIIKNEQFWLRNARLMNDFDELVHGVRMFTEFMNDDSELKTKYLAIMFAKGNKIGQKIQDRITVLLREILNDAYIGCFSEYNLDSKYGQSDIGRLSMWRAYGSDQSVALILNSHRFIATDSPLNVYAYPVIYGGREKFYSVLEEAIYAAETQLNHLKLMSDQQFLFSHELLFEHLALCFKHPAFEEEEEWRVVYRPKNTPSAYLKQLNVTLDGEPQTLFAIPLDESTPNTDGNLTIKSLTHKLLIGPCKNPGYLKRYFADLLREAGCEDAEDRVIATRIPIR